MQNEKQKQTEQSKLSVSFSGSISEVYDELLGDFLFEPYAVDLLDRISKPGVSSVLELACGTGRVTKHLLQQLPASVHITATDLQADMISVAQRNIDYPNVSWAVADMTNIPSGDNQYDLVVCQFGLMLVTDKHRAVQEMYRVLKPGGKLIFSVWGDINQNSVWKAGGEILEQFLGINPITQDPGPFSMTEPDTKALLKGTGFTGIKAESVKKNGQIATAAMAAKGFINGLPVSLAIKKKNPALLPVIEEALERLLIKQSGNNPLQSALNAFVFEAIK